MSAHDDPERLSVRDITFQNGNRARLVELQPGAAPPQVITALQLPEYKEVIVVIGGAASIDGLEDAKRSRLAQLFSRGVARAAITSRALIIDGGTDSGVMLLMGQGVADRGNKTPLLGVAPCGAVTFPGDQNTGDQRVPLEPNHTHFVLTPGNAFGDESRMIAALAATLVEKTPPPPASPASPPALPSNVSRSPATDAAPRSTGLVNEKTVVVVLAGGNLEGVSKTDILLAVRRGFTVIVLAGSGGLADKLAELVHTGTPSIADPELAEIVQDGTLRIFAQDKPVHALEQLIVSELGVNNTLVLAWRRFATYSQQANRFQAEYSRVQWWLLALGIAVTVFIAARLTLPVAYTAQGEVVIPAWLDTFSDSLPLKRAFALGWDRALSGAILIIPILTALLTTYLARFNAGLRWVVLRGAAESIKSAIYVYRTRPASYRAKPADPAVGAREEITREVELQRQIEYLSTQMMQSDVNLSGIKLYDGEIPPRETTAMQYGGIPDNGISALTPERYLAIRLDDQINYYSNRTVKKERELRRWQITALIAGALGTLFAAIGLQIWVAVTTAIAATFLTYLEQWQTRNTLIHYNQAGTSLQNIKQWWYALMPEQQADPEMVKRLVETTEQVTQSEQAGWVQQMQNRLAKLNEEQAKKPSGEG